MNCDQESAGYCKLKIAYSKYIKDNFCEECCDYCSYQEHCEDVCKIVKEQNRNNIKMQVTFDFDCGECGSCEVDETLTIFEHDIEKYLNGYFEGARNVKVEEMEEEEQ